MLPLIILFAKAPVAGKVKTRLAPPLKPEQAAALHEAMVAATWLRLQQLAGEAEIELHTDMETRAWPQAQPRRLQSEGDLGNRMLCALKTALRQGRPTVMIVGGDAPDVPLDYLRQMLASAADLTLGPAEDGGYYAIACRKTHAEMFDGVRWSTSDALADTVAAAQRCGLSVGLAPCWRDVDAFEDLLRLPEELLLQMGFVASKIEM